MSNFILSGFSDEISADFKTQLETVKNLDISHIEIRGVNGRNITDYTIEEVKELKYLLDKMEVKISAVGSPIGKIKITDDFEPHFKLFKHTVEIAMILNTKYIRLGKYKIPLKNHLPTYLGNK